MSCLSLLSTGIAGMHFCAWLITLALYSQPLFTCVYTMVDVYKSEDSPQEMIRPSIVGVLEIKLRTSDLVISGQPLSSIHISIGIAG